MIGLLKVSIEYLHAMKTLNCLVKNRVPQVAKDRREGL
jgi:hypothetical protein